MLTISIDFFIDRPRHRVIYGGMRVLFGLRTVVQYPHFSGRKDEEFAVTAVNRGDLWRLNYNKTVFRPRWESSPRRQSDGEGILPPRKYPLPI